MYRAGGGTCARRLGADVIVHGRDEAAGSDVVEQLLELNVDAQFIRADFADIDAVREMAETVRAETDGLDILVNNAGGLFRDGAVTDAGVEFTFHVNHLSPYLLTMELLDHLNNDARVVTTASSAHRGSVLDLDRIQTVENYSGIGAYSHSKLANILFARELATRLQDAGLSITSNSIHPGAIPGSGFSRFLPGPLPWLAQRLDRLPGVTSVADGAAELLFVAVSPRTAGVTGRYFTGLEPSTPTDAARDLEAAGRLWTTSADLLDIEEPLVDTGTDVDETTEPGDGVAANG